MKKSVTLVSLLVIYLLVSAALEGAGQTAPWMELSTDRINGVYTCPANITFTLKAAGASEENGTFPFQVLQDSEKEIMKGNVTLKNGKGEIKLNVAQPCTVILKVGEGSQTAEIGIACDPFRIKQSAAEPKDFDSFWDREKAALAKVPMNARLEPVAEFRKVNYGPEVECFDLTLDCTGGKPVRGYYARPRGARPKSLPAYLSLHSAGIRDSSLQAAWNKAKNNYISLDINAHGLENGQPNTFYNDLSKGELKGYASMGIESPETYYFKGMYLRIVRAVDFLTSQPEWDGKVLIAAGSSQGGGQSLIAGGIDQRVTEINAAVPAFCDLSAPAGVRKTGWPGRMAKTKNQIKTIGYFDACNFAARFKGKAGLLVGLADNTCPPAGILAAFNQLRGEKSIIILPVRGHGADPVSIKQEKDPVFLHTPKSE